MAPFQAQQFRQGFVVTLDTLLRMGPSTIVFQIFRLPSPGDLVRNALKERQGPLDRQQWSNRVRLGPGTEHSEVHDIAFTGESRWQTLENPRATLQNSQSIRLTVKEEGSSGPKDTFPVAMGLMELSKQWQQADPNASYHVTTYETEHPVKTTRFIEVSENAQNKSGKSLLKFIGFFNSISLHHMPYICSRAAQTQCFLRIPFCQINHGRNTIPRCILHYRSIRG